MGRRESSNILKEKVQEHPWPFFTKEEVSFLELELLRRAANAYEQVGLYQEAAECWSEREKLNQAAQLDAQGGDLIRAARTWLQTGCYQEALAAYCQLEEDFAQNMLGKLQAFLGQALCHLLGSRESPLPANSKLSKVAGWQAYRQARKLLASAETIDNLPLRVRCWEALGDYGGQLGRYDLVQEGYERALELVEERAAQIRLYRAYLSQAKSHADRLLCGQLEERLAVRSTEEGAGGSLDIAPPVTGQFILHRTLAGHREGVWGVAISPDGQTVVSGSVDKTIKVWNLSTGKEIHTLVAHRSAVCSVAISGGQILVSGSHDSTIKVWELSTGREIRTLAGHTNGVWGLAISPDGQTLVSGSGDKTIKVWEISTGREIRTLTGHTDAVNWGIAISSDGQTLVSGSGDKTIKVWELASGREIRTLTGHTDGVWGLAISPDGRTLVSGSGDKTIKVWELASGKEIRTLYAHRGGVYSVAISPDGQTLVSGSSDDTIKIWNMATGEEIGTLTGHANIVYRLVISSDGQTLISGSRDDTIKVWKAPKKAWQP